VALVTGASEGIGADTAEALAGVGASVALVSQSRDSMAQVAARIAAKRTTPLVLEADITDPRQAAGAIEWTVSELGRLDVLVNAADVVHIGPALGARLGMWDHMIAVNISATLHVIHAALPHLVRAASEGPRGVAHVVILSSAGRPGGAAGGGVYALTKLGMAGFADSLRQELMSLHVHVDVIEHTTTVDRILDIVTQR
jgi:NADP-dependent 3-hydroxy acid dehydrogenase YdfG